MSVSARRVAYDVLNQVERDRAWANPTLDAALRRSGLDERDRRLATELVYGTLRRQRALDQRLEPHLRRGLDPEVRVALRLGAHQLLDLRVPPHAAVNETVELVPRKVRGLVNAVLRKLAAEPEAAGEEPPGYPDWIVERLVGDLGSDDARAALAAMDQPVAVEPRADGYRQDPASAWVAEEVAAAAGERVLDLCAAPGGKATALAATGAAVTAVELHPARARTVVDSARRTGTTVDVVVADGRSAPFPDGCFDAVLVDAPCSGLGALRRRPDARWRVQPSAPLRLAAVQRDLLAEAARVLRPGGRLVYAVCTLTTAETTAVDEWLAERRPELEPEALTGPWRPRGRGGLVLPQDHDTDGMAVFRYRLRSPA